MPIVTPIPAENLLKTVIKGQFSTRPALRSVVAEMLARTLKEHYPPLSIAPSDLYMALPREGGGRALRPLLDVALQFLADDDVAGTQFGSCCFTHKLRARPL